MKVTIISNGAYQIVLKPETPLEILTIKELENKPLVSKYHESTQILDASSPNCLVISNKKEDSIKNDSSYAVLQCITELYISIAIFPVNWKTEGILKLISNIYNSDTCVLLKNETIKPGENFSVNLNISSTLKEMQFVITNLPFFNNLP